MMIFVLVRPRRDSSADEIPSSAGPLIKLLLLFALGPRSPTRAVARALALSALGGDARGRMSGSGARVRTRAARRVSPPDRCPVPSSPVRPSSPKSADLTADHRPGTGHRRHNPRPSRMPTNRAPEAGSARWYPAARTARQRQDPSALPPSSAGSIYPTRRGRR